MLHSSFLSHLLSPSTWPFQAHIVIHSPLELSVSFPFTLQSPLLIGSS